LLSRSGFKAWIAGPSASDRHAIAREARMLAEAALPAGERLRDSHIVAIGEAVPTPPDRLRPHVFSEAGSTGDLWSARAEKAEQVLYRLNPVNAAVDAFDRRGRSRERAQALSGDWGSAAGQMACALQPRADSDVLPVLLLGDRGLHVAHVQKSSDGHRVGPGVRYGWGVPLSRVTRFLKRDGTRHGTHELGFDDGSWVSVHFPVAGWGTLVEALSDLNSLSGAPGEA
jgi:hypothetical protein